MVDRAMCMLLPVLLILLRCVMSNERLELLNLFCYFCFSPGDRRGFKPGVHWNLMSLGETLDPELFPREEFWPMLPWRHDSSALIVGPRQLKVRPD